MRGQNARQVVGGGGSEPLECLLGVPGPQCPTFECGVCGRESGVELLTVPGGCLGNATLEFRAKRLELAAPRSKTLLALRIESVRVCLAARNRLSHRDIESVDLGLRTRGRLLERRLDTRRVVLALLDR